MSVSRGAWSALVHRRPDPSRIACLNSPQSPSAPRVAEHAEAFADFLRQETVGGRLLLVATALALMWANIAGDSYESFWSTHIAVGPEWLHLDLSLADWAADGLLAIFLFIAGLELKRELVVGELSDRQAAILPAAAALGGMVVPALVVLAVSGGAAADGGAWAIPVATDIAFALGVLALAGAALPSGVRAILLSVAVVDDLLAITLIAIVFTSDLSLEWMTAGVAACVLYALTFRLRMDRAWLLWIVAVIAWICVHASGVHATVAGVLLGLLTPVQPRIGDEHAPGDRLAHRLHPLSAAVAVPIFALAATGVSLGAVGDATGDRVAIGVFLAPLVGKVIGIYGSARLTVRLGLGRLPDEVAWADMLQSPCSAPSDTRSVSSSRGWRSPTKRLPNVPPPPSWQRRSSPRSPQFCSSKGNRGRVDRRARPLVISAPATSSASPSADVQHDRRRSARMRLRQPALGGPPARARFAGTPRFSSLRGHYAFHAHACTPETPCETGSVSASETAPRPRTPQAAGRSCRPASTRARSGARSRRSAGATPCRTSRPERAGRRRSRARPRRRRSTGPRHGGRSGRCRNASLLKHTFGTSDGR